MRQWLQQLMREVGVALGNEQEKKKLAINPLTTIEELLKQLNFLTYSTQTRNLAYQLQLRELLVSLNNAYLIDRGLQAIFQYNLMRSGADIIEAMLFCSLRQYSFLPAGSRSKAAASAYIKAAKSKGLVTKETAMTCSKIIDHRNNLHPDKQKDLLTKIDSKVVISLESIIPTLVQELRHYHFKVYPYLFE